MKRTLLVLDDMLPILDVLNKIAGDEFDIVLTTSLSQAKLLSTTAQFDIILTDINLGFDGYRGGFEFVDYLKNINFQGRIGLMSGYMQKIPEHLINTIAFTIDKPFTIECILKKLRSI